jgi:hypothetical protein
VGSVFGDTAYFYYNKYKDTTNEEELKTYLKDKKLENLDFSGSIFKDDIIFSGRELTGKLIFRHCRFNIPPDFSQVEGLEWIDPTDAHFSIRPRQRGKIWGWISRNWTTDSEIASRIRHLRKLMSDLKAHDVERDLFILERKAERGFLWRQVPRTWNPIRLLSPFLRALTPTLLMFLYGILSDCGRSLWRPFFFFAAKLGGFFFYYAGRISPSNYEYLTFDQGEGPLVTYWQLVKEIPQNPYLHDVLSFTLTHALPLVGSLNPARTELLKRLFGEKICMPFGIEMMSLLQAGLGALFLFLLLLALRNHFKIS